MSRSYTRAQAHEALVKAGVERGDTLFCSTSLGMFGVAEGVNSAEELNALWFEALCAAVGPEGTIIVPTYSYTIGRSRRCTPRCFDPETSAAGIGPFPEWFRQQPGVRRSLDPMMSVAVLGPQAQQILSDLPPTSYGAGCFFARFMQLPRAKCCNIGLGPNWMAFIHHVDHLYAVPHRYDKLFYGLRQMEPQGEAVPTFWVYAVPILCPPSEANAHRVGANAVAAGIFRYSSLARGRIYVAPAKAYFDFTCQAVAQDPWALATGPADDPLNLESARFVPFSLSKAPETSLAQYLQFLLGSYQTHPLSSVLALAMTEIQKGFPVERQDIRTGTTVRDFIVPERWQSQRLRVHGPGLDIDLGLEMASDQVKPVLGALPFAGTVDGATLVQHVIPLTADMPVQTYAQRDWGFRLSATAVATIQSEGRYQVQQETISGLGLMPILTLWPHDRRPPRLIIAVSLADTWGGEGEATAAIALIKTIEKPAVLANWRQNSVAVVFHPGAVGLAAWLTTVDPAMVRDCRLLLRLGALDSEATWEILVDKTSSNFPSIAGCREIPVSKESLEQMIVPAGGNPLVDRQTLPTLPPLAFVHCPSGCTSWEHWDAQKAADRLFGIVGALVTSVCCTKDDLYA